MYLFCGENWSLAIGSFPRSPTFPFGEGGPPKVVDEVKTVDTQYALNSNLTHRSAPSLRGAPLPKGEGQGRGRLTDKPKFENSFPVPWFCMSGTARLPPRKLSDPPIDPLREQPRIVPHEGRIPWVGDEPQLHQHRRHLGLAENVQPRPRLHSSIA